MPNNSQIWCQFTQVPTLLALPWWVKQTAPGAGKKFKRETNTLLASVNLSNAMFTPGFSQLNDDIVGCNSIIGSILKSHQWKF